MTGSFIPLFEGHDPNIMNDLLFQMPQKSNVCPACDGTGIKKWGKLGVRACVKCKGKGVLK